MNTYECPLCNTEFEGEMCHGSCPMSKGCAMVRCPRCSYEFVQDGKLSSFFRRLFKTGDSSHASPRN